MDTARSDRGQEARDTQGRDALATWLRCFNAPWVGGRPGRLAGRGWFPFRRCRRRGRWRPARGIDAGSPPWAVSPARRGSGRARMLSRRLWSAPITPIFADSEWTTGHRSSSPRRSRRPRRTLFVETPPASCRPRSPLRSCTPLQFRFAFHQVLSRDWRFGLCYYEMSAWPVGGSRQMVCRVALALRAFVRCPGFPPPSPEPAHTRHSRRV
jgi:hypothetical protein